MMDRVAAIDLALPLLKDFEQGPSGGAALISYKCPAGVWTIGYGHTGTDVKEGTKITAHAAEALLRSDALRFAYQVERTCPNGTPAQHAALICFAFNCGGWKNSSVVRLHNAGDFAGAAAAFAMWNKARNGEGKLVPLRGLTRRRAAEAALYLSDDGQEDPQRTRAADTTGEKPLTQSRTMAGTTTAGAAVAASEVANSLTDAQGLLEPLAAYSDTIRTVFLLVAIAAIAFTAWARYQDRKAGRR